MTEGAHKINNYFSITNHLPLNKDKANDKNKTMNVSRLRDVEHLLQLHCQCPVVLREVSVRTKRERSYKMIFKRKDKPPLHTHTQMARLTL